MIVYDWILAFGSLAVVLSLGMAIWCIRSFRQCKQHPIIHRWRK